MKRISILLVAASLTIIMAACQNNQAQAPAPTPTPPAAETAEPSGQENITQVGDVDAFAFYSQAMQALEAALANAESFGMGTYTGFNVHMGEEFYSLESDIWLWQVNHGETEADAKFDILTSINGEQTSKIIYLLDGTATTEIEGVRTQAPSTVEALFEEAGITQADLFPISFNQADIIEQEGYEIDGGMELIFTLDASNIGGLSEKATERLEALGVDIGDTNITPTTVNFFVILDEDNNFAVADAFVTFELFLVDGEFVFIEMVMAVEYFQFGDVDIDFPDDLGTL